MSARLVLEMLGTFRAEVDGDPVPTDAWRQRRAASVVKLLALSPRHRMSREQLLEALWPDLTPDAAGVNLRKAVHFARRALGGEQTIAVRSGWLELWPDGDLITDVGRFEEASNRALSSSGGGKEASRGAAELYPGDLLPDDRYEPWCEDRRFALRETYLSVLRRAEMWERLLELEPTDEEAHRELMRTQLGIGNRQAAIRQFERLREVLREELGVAPDPQSVALYEQVLAGEGREAPTAAERARALLAWGLIHWKRRDFEEAERTAAEARALAVDAGLGAELGEASALLAAISQARGGWRSFLRDELLETVRRTPDLAPFVFDANLCFTEFCLYLPGGTGELAVFAAELREVATSTASKRALALATLMEGETELLEGRPDEAEETLARAVELHREASADSGYSLSLERLAEASTAHGRRWNARRLLERAERIAQGTPLAGHLLVKIFGARIGSAPDPEEARAAVIDAERSLAGIDVCESCSMTFRVAASNASARVGAVSSARRHLEEADRISAMWQGGPWPAAVCEATGHLEASLGHGEKAREELERAAALFDRSARPLEAARCRASAAALRAVSR